MKTITGNISYTLNISDEGEWTIICGSESDSAEQILNNDMASLAMAQRVMEICAIRLREEKKELKGIAKKFMSQKLNKVIDGRFGLKIICDYMMDSYEPYMEYLNAKKDELNKQ